MDPGLRIILEFMAISSGMALIFCVAYILYGRLWFVAKAEGAPVPLTRILGMPFRRIKASAIVAPYIAARKGGLEISLEQLERHYLDEGNPAAVVEGMLSAKAEGRSLSFDEACSLERAKHDMAAVALDEAKRTG